MLFYVYIIKSEKDNSYYKGFTLDYLERLQQHNNAFSKYTSSKMPWRLVYVEEHVSKTEALKRERSLKKATKQRIEALIVSEKNILYKS
jgi:putative endonuclease